jgi:DNA polymerase elongation subunit (family B)
VRMFISNILKMIFLISIFVKSITTMSTSSSKLVEMCPYYWGTYEEGGTIGMRIFGLNEKNENCFVRVVDFYPYAYLELPSNINWTLPIINALSIRLDTIAGENCKPIKKEFKISKKLYYAKYDTDMKEKEYPFLKCYFSSPTDLKQFSWKLKYEIYVGGIGKIQLKLHEKESNPILQFQCARNIKPTSWLSFSGKKISSDDDKESTCDHEYHVSSKNFAPIDKKIVARPKILSVDIEVNSTNPNKVPSADNPGDKIFQISCVICRSGDPEKDWEKYILTLCKNKNGEIVDLNPDKLGPGIEVLGFETEGDLLEGFTDLVRETKPNILIGYNIFRFDLPYMYERSKLARVTSGYDQLSFIKGEHAKEKEIKWSSQAFGDQKMKFMDAQGRLWIDLYAVISKDYKLENYKLKTVSEFFLQGQTKDDLSHKGIFKCYRMFTPDSLAICAKYCVQDSNLVLKLFEKLQMWIGLCEMSNTCNVPIFTLFTQGQQIKMYSQVYKKCLQENIVIDSESYNLCSSGEETEKYTGAYVFPPVPGVYDMATSFDFCITGDSMVSLSRGCSKRIDHILKSDTVWSHDKEGKGIVSSNSLGVKSMGVKNIVKVTLLDGRTIKCTPDHKFFTQGGEWVEAKDLVTSTSWDGKKMTKVPGTKVVIGLELPEDIVGDDERGWSVLDYDMECYENREKSLAFSRVLGFVLADGWIGDRQSEACFGTMLDAKMFCKDIELLTEGKQSTIRERTRDTTKGSTFTVNVLSEICKKIISLDGIVQGKRSTQKPSLPKFLLDDNCPVSILREFLGGLFGGDGCAPYLTNKTATQKSGFGFVSLKWDTIKIHGDDMQVVMGQLCKMLEKVGIIFRQLDPTEVNYTDINMRPKDIEINPRFSYIIVTSSENNLLFSKKVGFRYCAYKSCRLSVASSYRRLCENVNNQHNKVITKTNENYNSFKTNPYISFFKDEETNIKKVVPQISKDNLSRRIKRSWNKLDFEKKQRYLSVEVNDWGGNIDKSLNKARDEIFNKEVPLNERFSLSWKQDIYYRRNDPERVLSLLPEFFPDALEYVNLLGVRDWFAQFGQKHTKVYCVSRFSTHIPTFSLEVVDVRECGSEEVFDLLEVQDHHNFFANGVCVSNCSLYPSAIIAYNIDYTTLVLDEKIPDSLCHIFEWGDHINCKCPCAVIKKAVKGVTCADRKFRFLKSPPGIIPTLLKNLLDARKKTNSEKKELTKLLPSLQGVELEDMERTIVVLDKRQLSYKVNANSMYGSMGARKGSLPFLPGAMCTTFKGRVSIEKAAKWLIDNHKVNLIYGDSVVKDTPIYVRVNGLLDICTICNLSEKYGNREWKECLEDGKQDKEFYEFDNVNIETWTKTGWTKLHRVIRHDCGKKIIRVLTHTGMVDVTDDHSLLLSSGLKTSSKDIENGTELLHNDHPLCDEIECKITEDEATIMGFFMGDGSCGDYQCPSGQKSTWALNNASQKIIDKYLKLCKEVYNQFEWVTMDTIDSSGVYKISLRSKGDVSVREWIKSYRKTMYHEKSKIIPIEILNSPLNIRQAFFNGLYDADGDKDKHGYTRIDQKNQISAAHICWLGSSLGYKTSINIRSDKENVYRVTMTRKKQRKNLVAVKKMSEIDYNGYVYDLTTDNHQFAAGIGKIIVSNTDSCYVSFPQYQTPDKARELDSLCKQIESEVSLQFPPPMKLAYEDHIFYKYLILSKKRYVALTCDLDGNVEKKLTIRGILLNRRDNAKFERDMYTNMLMKCFYKEPLNDVMYLLTQEMSKILQKNVDVKDLVISKSIGEVGNYKIRELNVDNKLCQKRLESLDLYDESADLETVRKILNKYREKEDISGYEFTTPIEYQIVKEYIALGLPAQVQLAEKIRNRGGRVEVNERLGFVVIETKFGPKGKVSQKIEDVDYFKEHSGSLKIDPLYYLTKSSKQIDEVLTAVYKEKKLYETCYKYRENYYKVIKQLQGIFAPKIILVDD